MRLPSKISSVLQTAQQYILRTLGQRGWQYHAVDEDDKTHSPTDSKSSRTRKCISSPRASGRSLSTAAATLVVLVTLGYILLPWNSQALWQPNRHQHHMMHFLVPSAVPDSELCKTILSSVVLGYPVPEIVNYNETLDDTGRESDRERSKLKILSDYFSKISTKSDNDIAVVLETSYTWVQLRPEVLLERYYTLTHQADVELEKLYSIEDVTTRGVRQSIIMSTGPIQDDDVDRVGTIVGTVSAMRGLYRELNAQAIGTLGEVNSQTLLANIYRRQEAQRELLLQQHWSWLWRKWLLFTGSLQSADGSLNHPGDHEDFEFGIGLDSTSNIGMPIDARSNFQWTAHKSHTYGYDMSTLPNDLASSTPPFWTPSGTHQRARSTWTDVNLLEDIASGNVPVFINFPWSITNFQRSEWTEFWMQPHTKMLLEESFAIPRLPFASVVGPNGIEHTFWDASVRFDRAGVKTVEGAWATWHEICDKNETWIAAQI